MKTLYLLYFTLYLLVVRFIVASSIRNDTINDRTLIAA